MWLTVKDGAKSETCQAFQAGVLPRTLSSLLSISGQLTLLKNQSLVWYLEQSTNFSICQTSSLNTVSMENCIWNFTLMHEKEYTLLTISSTILLIVRKQKHSGLCTRNFFLRVEIKEGVHSCG